METIGMWQQVGFLADVFERFKRAGLSIDLIGSSETNVTVSLDPSGNLVSSNVLDALCTDLAEVCRVKVIAPCSAVTLVGRGMRSLLHKLTDVWGEFGRERVHLVSQSSNDLNLTFVVDESIADDLLPRLHALLIQSGAMPVDQGAVFGPSWKQIAAPAPVRIAPWWHGKREALLDAARHGTPRYAYDIDVVRARARSLAGVTAVDRRLYALKANAHPEILRALHAEGFGFECVSLAEVERAFAAVPGLDPAQVLFTPSFAPRAEYAAALARGVTVTVDNVAVLRDWADDFRGKDIFLRLDPGFGAGHHAKVRTGGKEAKFGLSPDALDAAVAAARAAGARIVGLHAHIGSGIFEADQWAAVYALLARLADRVGTVRHLDIGGGLGVAYDGDDTGFDLPAYASVLAQLKQGYPQYSLWIEPGRFLVAEAGVLLAQVTQVNTKDGVRRVGLDAGMNALIRPALYDAFHGIHNLTRLDAAPGEPAEIVGPICESSDVLGHRRRLPDATAEGDVVLVEHAGAYGFAMANTYNLRALPAEEILDA
jgi:diaminopimelate decarboxylase/aspartate kinase